MAVTVDFEPIKVAIYDWLNQALNDGDDTTETAIPIIRAEDNSVRPQEGELFVEFKFLTGLVKIGVNDEKVPVSGQPTMFTLRGQRQITVSVTVFGENSAACMAQIQQSLSSPIECAILRAAGLAVRQDDAISDASVFLETSFENRSVLDVIFGLTLEKTVDLGTIESTELDGTALPGGQSIIVDKNNP
jgi:hypothetical protein